MDLKCVLDYYFIEIFNLSVLASSLTPVLTLFVVSFKRAFCFVGYIDMYGCKYDRCTTMLSCFFFFYQNSALGCKLLMFYLSVTFFISDADFCNKKCT